MGQNNSSNPLRENLESLHNQMMKHAGADYDIATTTTLTYDQFLAYITQLNQICREYKDSEGHMLVFAVKKGTDSTVFWKATVRIACVKLNTANNKVQSYRLLNIRQFLQVFRRVTYECTGGTLGSMEGVIGAESTEDGSSVAQGPAVPIPPTVAASMVLGGMQEVGQATPTPFPTSQEQTESPGAVGGWDVNLSECMICLERKPDVILPCAHAYCLPCIEQWSVVEKTCPMCRESLESTDDTWVLSEAPDSDQVNEEIRKTLISLAGTQGEAPT
ncbi:RING finger protein 141-like isoform X3 [Eriocheir sinensis]|uniref:RING finger protein 141-like isoform X3 n=1 Tax=Eriocheir sinensis TaxID=95602 RepID=UPI0021C7D12A|nr:RING finger protein 141-like isoform X3 [Eriocheir sinensis]